MANYVQTGDFVDYTPGSAVTAGDVVVQEELVGVAVHDIAASALGAIRVDGVFDIAKDGNSMAAGVKVYWDASYSRVTETVGSNKLVGKVVIAAAAGDSTARVRLNQ
jgi:predicted RecA/RadA family phage recombinase